MTMPNASPSREPLPLKNSSPRLSAEQLARAAARRPASQRLSEQLKKMLAETPKGPR
jgi:hypothetical protein